MFRRLRRERDERGVSMTLVAVCMTPLLLMAGAFSVDLGLTVSGGQQVQSLADAAALDTARYAEYADLQSNPTSIINADALLAANDNNYAYSSLTATLGTWSNGAFSVPSGGCQIRTPIPQYPNFCTAVKISATGPAPQIFMGRTVGVTRTAIAQIAPESVFSVGSYLAAFSAQSGGVQTQQTSVLDTLLSTALGPTGNAAVSVKLVGYEGLAATYLSIGNLITYSNNLLTPSTIMSQSLTASQWQTILTNAVKAQCGSGSNPCNGCSTTACNAYNDALANFSFANNNAITLCQLISINGSAWNSSTNTCSLSTPTQEELTASLNVLQFFSTEAEIANGSNALNLTSALGLSLLGLTVGSVSLTASVISPPAIGVGPIGTTASTGQVNVDMKIGITVPLLGAATIDIPITGADATATLDNMNCQGGLNGSTLSGPTLNSAQIAGQTTTLTAGVTLSGVNLTTLTIAGSGTQHAKFTAANVPPSAATAGGATPNPYPILGTNPTPSFSPSSFGLGIPTLAGTLLTTVLSPILQPVLQSLGVSVGDADIADYGYNCGDVQLVQ